MSMHPVSVARALAKLLHRGQFYGGGEPYAEHHVAGVVGLVRWQHPDNWKAETVAWLHDVIEDTHMTLGDLWNTGFGTEIYQAVELLTRQPGQTYAAYIDRIREAPGQHGVLARIVKIADLRFNLSEIERTGRKSGNRGRYHDALTSLKEAS